MSAEKTAGCLSLFSILTTVFIILKLTGFINWSWWLVTLPLWGVYALIIIIVLLITLTVSLISKIFKK